jgi:hypothetical protein
MVDLALSSSLRYAPRRVRPMGTRKFGDWMLKLYGIAYQTDAPRRELVDAALRAAESALPSQAAGAGRYGVGFVGIHDGRDSNFVFVSWWENDNELQHRVFFSAPDRPAGLRAATQEEPIACVWDLSVIAHERDAWIRHVLANPAGPDPSGYLADTVSGDF